MVPFGPPPRFEEVFSHPNAEIIVCKPCAEISGISEDMLANNAVFGGMTEMYAHASKPDTKVINF